MKMKVVLCQMLRVTFTERKRTFVGYGGMEGTVVINVFWLSVDFKEVLLSAYVNVNS